MGRNLLRLGMVALSFAIVSAGCARRASVARPSRPVPPESPFAKVRVGMSLKEVFDTIGPPTDSRVYPTGKSWIPFYFGNDSVRHEALYKGQGRITCSGIGAFGGGGLRVIRVEYDPTEYGYNSRRAR